MKSDLSATISQLLDDVKDFDSFDLALMRAAAGIISGWNGCHTPTEEFLRDQLLNYAVAGPAMQPDTRFDGQVEEFRENWMKIRHAVSVYGPILSDSAAPAEKAPVA